MNKVGGRRNFGYGKKMEWAGKQAIRNRYGGGHYATVAAHAGRWRQFTAWCRDARGIRDARAVDREALAAYGRAIADKVTTNGMSVAYAQNLLSTVNVVLESLRGDRRVRLAPAHVVGQRTHLRTEPPAGLDRSAVRQCAAQLRSDGRERVAAVVELARGLGLRPREASMLDARAALRQAKQQDAVNITAGTKGGRGHRVNRWVPVSAATVGALERAASVQGSGRNLIPAELSWRQWNTRIHHVWAAVRQEYGLGKLHDLRAAYACERYRALTGSSAPAVAGRRLAERNADRAAREIIAQELGHARCEVVATYVGSAR